jgi:hypothetical protein
MNMNGFVRPGFSGWIQLGCVLVLTLVATVALAGGNGNNQCDVPGEYPDVIVGSLHQEQRYGHVGDITAFSIGTNSCNIGTCWLDWFSHNAGSSLHPVIGQSMYRLKDGRFEQIGQSWLKHGFTALSQNLCSPNCLGTSGTHLGVDCSDPYSAGLNGQQSNLGPKFEVNPVAGTHPHPFATAGQTGNSIFKRLQVHDADMDPALNSGAQYWVEGQYITKDDAEAARQNNNASYRSISVSGNGTFFDINFAGPTVREDPAIRVWAETDPTVDMIDIQVPKDGLFILGAKVTDLGGGVWHYEYAIHNLNSLRSGATFSVPVPDGATISNIGFHDVDYHSGEPYSGTDWPNNGGADFEVSWATEPAVVNPNANAIRWGTLYNFRFDADVEPAIHDVALGFFRTGPPSEIVVQTWTPSMCDADGTCGPGETCRNCPADCADNICDAEENVCTCVDCGTYPEVETACGDAIDNDCDGLADCNDPDCCGFAACAPPDFDKDGFQGCGDCHPSNPDIWAAPTEVRDILWLDNTRMVWTAPLDPGTVDLVNYEILRTTRVSNFGAAVTQCLEPAVPTDTSLVDPDIPFLPENLFAYLARATNDCDLGIGTLGDSTLGEREGRSCP